jgi:putative acetyltransferase
MSEHVQIIKAANADADAIKKLVFGILKDYGLEPDPASTDKDLDDIQKNYWQNKGCFYVLKEDGRIIGSFGLYKINDELCELRKMYLDKNFRGHKLGKKMMEEAFLHAKNLGYKSIMLETASVLKEAIALYKKYGFAPCTADHISARCDQAYICNIP